MAPTILPLSSSSSIRSGRWGDSPYPNGAAGGGGGGADAYPRSERSVPLVLRRLTKFKSMDFELAFWQLTYLVVSPRRVYKQVYHHKQTKNVWARDDPAMLILISGCIALAGAAWSLVYRRSLLGCIYIVLRMIFRDFILTSLLTALILYTLSNRLLLSSPNTSSQPQHSVGPSDTRVELAYAFDVAVNSFFPAFLTLGGGGLVLASVIVRDNWVCLFFGNTLFLIAAVQYTYVTYLGYNALPFVARSELLLAPLLPIFGGYLLSLLGFNISRHALELYFGQSWT